MEKFNKNIDGIRKMLSDKKGKKYAITNEDLVQLDEYIKNLYLKVLCTVVQYENDPTEMQVLYLKRIVNGMKVEEPVEEYMRKGLEISDTDVQEFLSIIAENKIKYYFTLDGLLLVSMGNLEEANYEYLAEIVELIGVNKDDLEYISLVAKSVLRQESSFYDEAKGFINERVRNVDVTPYIGNYYAGLIVDTDEMKHYSAPDKKLSTNIQYPTKFRERIVIFENMDINIEEHWSFEGCEKVIFKNCLLQGTNYNIKFSNIGTIKFEGCIIQNFKNRVGMLYSVNNLVINTSEFFECGYREEKRASGGLFIVAAGKCESVRLENSKLMNCYIQATGSWPDDARGIFIAFRDGANVLLIMDNEFYGCACIEGSYNRDKGIASLWNVTTKEENNNKCTGSVTRIFY